ncbi:unnamed protein product [Pleuronectes platessa]|uniref:UDP-glucuronosyltransferase n=1 Tax=Pleuronectes platessa TaxID=8262 RepID=A0A9N7TZE1_PLEPL|nr:unnamed protein product [Pleuronectes platessa]
MPPDGNIKRFLLLLSVVFLTLRICHGGRILIVPMEGSHWVNMDIMIRALHSRGHSIDVVRTDESWYIKDHSLHYNTITVSVSETFNHDFINPIVKKIIDIERGESSALTFASLQVEMFTAMFNMHRITCQMATVMFKDKDLMNSLKERKYDLVLTDPAWGAEVFVQSSGEHGVIIMSLGTFVSELPADMTNKMAAAFAKLPQKVIWRHKGDRPATLGNNTLLVDWMPQNDLLGHPKIKLFVAHGGTNGVQEAIYHGVPVVGLPVFFDQNDNLLRLKERGGAKILTLATVDKDSNFLEAIQEVLTEPSYRLNMQRLSRLHRDQPMKPLDTALFWIEFVMRHKGRGRHTTALEGSEKEESKARAAACGTVLSASTILPPSLTGPSAIGAGRQRRTEVGGKAEKETPHGRGQCSDEVEETEK